MITRQGKTSPDEMNDSFLANQRYGTHYGYALPTDSLPLSVVEQLTCSGELDDLPVVKK